MWLGYKILNNKCLEGYLELCWKNCIFGLITALEKHFIICVIVVRLYFPVVIPSLKGKEKKCLK